MTTPPNTVGEIEELRMQFIQTWDSGQFEWNHHDGDSLGEKPNSLWRVWNEFIEPNLLAQHRKYQEEMKKVQNYSRYSARFLNGTSDGVSRAYFYLREKLQALTPEETKTNLK